MQIATELDLRKPPFDTQSLKIELESPNTTLPVSVKAPNYEYKVELVTGAMLEQLKNQLNTAGTAGWRVVEIHMININPNGPTITRAIVVYEKPKA